MNETTRVPGHSGLPGVTTAGVREYIYIIYIIRVVDLYLCAYMFCFALFDSIKRLFKVLRLDFTARPLPPDYLEADAQGSPELSLVVVWSCQIHQAATHQPISNSIFMNGELTFKIPKYLYIYSASTSIMGGRNLKLSATISLHVDVNPICSWGERKDVVM